MSVKEPPIKPPVEAAEMGPPTVPIFHHPPHMSLFDRKTWSIIGSFFLVLRYWRSSTIIFVWKMEDWEQVGYFLSIAPSIT